MSEESVSHEDGPHDPHAPHGPMDHAAWKSLMHSMLDGTLDHASSERFAAIIAMDPFRAREFARAAMLHDAIEHELSAAPIGRRTARNMKWMLVPRRLAVAALLAITVGAFVFVATRGSPANAAQGELERIATAATVEMRTYVIRATVSDSRAHAKDARRDGRTQPSIDDAVLRVGAPGSYVLTRTGDDGASIVTGSNGVRSWSVPGRGPVRVSSDPSRFRGALPGEQHGLPFVDPKDGLDSLMRSYDIVLGKPAEISGHNARLITATRKSNVQRGPKSVEIWYDPVTAVIVRMQLDRLPQAQGGPRAVTLDLVAQSPLDPAFFNHEFHHVADRQVINED